MAPKISPSLVSKMKQKASLARVKTRIAAFAFSKKGNLLGTAMNNISSWNSYESYQERCQKGQDCKYSGRHAESELMKKFGQCIDTILIIRIGKSGDILKVDPCEKCKKTAKKLGIKIISVDESDT